MNEKKLILSKHVVTLGGNKYPLRFHVRAIMALQKELGENALTRLSNNEYEALIVALWGAMLHATPEITLSEVYNLIDGESLESIGKAFAILTAAVQEGASVTDPAAKKKKAKTAKRKK